MNDVSSKLGVKSDREEVASNFRELGDLLLIKFSQLEDVKEGLRDMLVY
jgi:hypothetical protein